MTNTTEATTSRKKERVEAERWPFHMNSRPISQFSPDSHFPRACFSAQNRKSQRCISHSKSKVQPHLSTTKVSLLLIIMGPMVNPSNNFKHTNNTMQKQTDQQSLSVPRSDKRNGSNNTTTLVCELGGTRTGRRNLKHNS